MISDSKDIFFATPEDQHAKEIQRKMNGVWELESFYFDNKPWNNDKNPKGRILFHKDRNLVLVAINASDITTSKDEKEFLSKLIFYLAKWEIKSSTTIHNVIKASSRERIGVSEKRNVEFTPEGHLKLSGIHPRLKKPMELIWRPVAIELQQEVTVEPWMQPIFIEQTNSTIFQQLYGVMTLTEDGHIFFETNTGAMEAADKPEPSFILDNILFFQGRYQKESEDNDTVTLNCKIEIFSDIRLYNQTLQITVSKRENGLVTFKALDREFIFQISSLRPIVANEHASKIQL